MRLKTYLCLGLVLVLALGMGCSSGGSSSGSSSGGGSPATIVGTWNLVSSTGGTWAQQVVFNSNGTGSTSGGTAPSQTFTWTQQGSQVVMTFQGGGTLTINNVTSPVGNSNTLADSSGRTATYSRA
jgi:hypothetical protein